MVRALRLSPLDDVATVLDDAPVGSEVAGVTLIEPIGRGHKVALHPVGAGATVRKYGYAIGVARQAIAAGAHVHTHNLASALDAGANRQVASVEAAAAAAADRGFMGYIRADGRVGTRNEIWVLPTVGCVARTAERIAAGAAANLPAGIDGVHAFTHPHGCSQIGQDLAGVRGVLAALAAHPNAAGVLLVGLGCEENQIADLVAGIDPGARVRLRTLVAQASADEVAEGIALVRELAEAGAMERRPARLADLVLGVKCGGSDGLSGLTANPLVGRVADAVAGAGGGVILTEIPEIFGAEHLLMARAETPELADAVAALVAAFKRDLAANGEAIADNPSPGNIAGGITTLEEKALGAVQKGGHAPLTDVIGYGGRATRRGLTLLEAPGNDAVSSTALIAAGATMLLFTTGRGTPLGFPAPTVKIASNHDLARRKPGWIDFDAGDVLDLGIDVAAGRLLDRIVAIASGEACAAERNGEREIAIWKRGITL